MQLDIVVGDVDSCAILWIFFVSFACNIARTSVYEWCVFDVISVVIWTNNRNK